MGTKNRAWLEYQGGGRGSGGPWCGLLVEPSFEDPAFFCSSQRGAQCAQVACMRGGRCCSRSAPCSGEGTNTSSHSWHLGSLHIFSSLWSAFAPLGIFTHLCPSFQGVLKPTFKFLVLLELMISSLRCIYQTRLGTFRVVWSQTCIVYISKNLESLKCLTINHLLE